jgi:hypothetical protein
MQHVLLFFVKRISVAAFADLFTILQSPAGLFLAYFAYFEKNRVGL